MNFDSSNMHYDEIGSLDPLITLVLWFGGKK